MAIARAIGINSCLHFYLDWLEWLIESKRKRVVLSIDSKLAILRKIREGVPQIRLAE